MQLPRIRHGFDAAVGRAFQKRRAPFANFDHPPIGVAAIA
jgi:hypothetical protein